MLYYLAVGILLYLIFIGLNIKNKYKANDTESLIMFLLLILFWPMFIIVYVQQRLKKETNG